METVAAVLGTIEAKFAKEDYGELSLALNSLGDLLRDPETRSSAQVENSIPSLVAITNSTFSHLETEPKSAAAHEAYRVLINLTADNDSSRTRLTSLETEYLRVFWSNTKRALLETLLGDLAQSRVLVFLSQFIHNSENLKEYTSFFQSIQLEKGLCHYIRSQVRTSTDEEEVFDLLVNPLEILSETILESSLSLEDLGAVIESFQVLTGLLSAVSDDELMETVNEVFTYLSSVLYTSTAVDDMPQIDELRPTEALLDILQKLACAPVCQSFKDITLIKRRVFSALGNISSMATYRNEVDVVINIETILHTTDPYALSAAAIGLGNSINSRESQKLCLHKIKEQFSLRSFIDSFFKVPFYDVVQYQAFHLLSNLLDCEVAGEILHNETAMERIPQYTKVVIDNSRYYKEVVSIYTKFAKKLVRVGFVEGKEVLYRHTGLWKAFNNIELDLELSVSIELEEINLVLLQAYLARGNEPTGKENRCFTKALLQATVSDANLNTNVSIHFVLEKIKTIGMLLSLFNQRLVDAAQLLASTYHGDRADYDINFLQPLSRVLEKLQETVTASEGAEGPAQRAQYDALVNNVKFVAASAVPFAKGDEIVAEKARKLLGGVLQQ